MDDLDIAFAGIVRQAEMLRNGEITAPRLAEIYLERIERLNPEINAFNAVCAERAPLLGVPIAVKDNIDVAGHVTSVGTGAFSELAAADAEIVRRLRAAG